MIRLSNIQLPLDHDANALENAILTMLDISADQLVQFTVFRRGYDARQKTNIMLIYTLDVETTCNEQLLSQFADHQLVKVAPDLGYYPVAQAPANLAERLIIIVLLCLWFFDVLCIGTNGLRSHRAWAW